MMNRRIGKQNTAQVFLLNLHSMDDMVYRQFYEAVSPKRRLRADRYCRHEDALRCVMSEMLVRYVYHHIRKGTQSPEFVYPLHEKPYLSNDRSFHFSVSHTGMFLAVGYAQGEIGIDIEQINRPLNRKSIAASVFTPEEQAYIFGTSKEPIWILRFAQLWTAKESYLKYLGCGFRKSPLSFSVNLENKTIYEKESGIVPEIAVLGNRLTEDYYLTACGTIGNLSLEFVTYHSIMDILVKQNHKVH